MNIFQHALYFIYSILSYLTASIVLSFLLFFYFTLHKNVLTSLPQAKWQFVNSQFWRLT